MRIFKTGSFNPLLRWRWDVGSAFGYATTKRGAASAARACLAQHSDV